MVVECNEVDGFHLVTVNYAHDEESISQNDLLLLSKVKVSKLNWLPLKFCLFGSSGFSINCIYHGILYMM